MKQISALAIASPFRKVSVKSFPKQGDYRMAKNLQKKNNYEPKATQLSTMTRKVDLIRKDVYLKMTNFQAEFLVWPSIDALRSRF